MKKKRVLVIEDDNAVMDATSEILSDVLLDEVSLEIVNCNNGLSAIQLLKDSVFDLLITDLRLPGMNGDEVIRSMKQRGGPNQATPVILVSGYLEDFNSGKASMGSGDLGTIYLLEKPFHLVDLEQVVKVWLADIDSLSRKIA